MGVELTPGQAVTAHGWWHPKLQLTWPDIVLADKLTFPFLLNTLNLSAKQIHHMQPEGTMWVASQKATLSDCPTMFPMWKLHHIHDFKADLGDIIAMGWKTDIMMQIGINYETLVQIGLTVDTMIFFKHITLAGWSALGLQKAHVAKMNTETLGRTFNMSKTDIMRALK